jgi:hypothetical protein
MSGDAVVLIVVALIAGVVGPGVSALLLGRQRQSDKRQDWARQDQVAARAAEAADALVASNEEVARVAATASRIQLEKLGEIHTLVNSDMTASRTNEMNATILLAAVLRRLHDPTAEDSAAIDLADARITELRAILADRLIQQKAVEAQQAASAAAGT